jgi:haloalkane dehalogenase
MESLELDRVVLVVHDWGGFVGLSWACDNPDRIASLVISDTGFFADGRWHGLADAMRTPEQGEQLVDGMTLEGFTAMMASISKGIGPDDAREYFKAFADEPRRRGQLELYRSGDFAKLEPYEGRLAALGVPFLALWGEDDPFAPVAGAQRFAREGAGGGDVRVQVIPGTGHFVYEDAPGTAAQALASFLAEAAPR